MNKTILLVMHDINYGGAGKMFAFLANELSKLGYIVHVFTYEGSNPNYFLDKKVKYHYEDKIPESKIIRRIKPIFTVRQKIKKLKPSIVISFLPNANFYTIIGSLYTKSKTIITERSDPFNEKGFLLSIKRYFFKFADGAVFQTEGAKKYYPLIMQKKSKVIANPVTLKKSTRIEYNKRKNTITFVARFDFKQKRQDIMLKAFSHVHSKIPSLTLEFYGDGVDLEKSKLMVKELGLDNHVIFHGKVDDVMSHIKNSLMFVSTSDYEGISNSLIEAMALGLPVVTTNSSPGGARMLVSNKVNGILVDTGSINQIAEAIIELVENPEYADKLGENAQGIVDKYSPNIIRDKWDSYLKEVMVND